MREDLETEFTTIAETAIQNAELLDCSLEEYRDGLRLMVGELKTRLACVESELANRE